MARVNLTLSETQPNQRWVSLVLEGLDPAVVTEALGIPPNLVPRPEVLAQAEAAGFRFRTWMLSTQGIMTTHYLSEHLKWLLSRLGEKEERFFQLTRDAQSAALAIRGAKKRWEIDEYELESFTARLGVTVHYEVMIFNNVDLEDQTESE